MGSNEIHYEVWDEIVIHLQTVEIGEWVISSHTLQNFRLLIHAESKIKAC